MPRFGHVAVLNMTSIGAAVGLMVAGFSHSLAVFGLGLFANGVFAAAILTASMAVMSATVSPERRGAVLGQILFPFYIGGGGGPLLCPRGLGPGPPGVFRVAPALSLAPLLAPFPRPRHSTATRSPVTPRSAPSAATPVP